MYFIKMVLILKDCLTRDYGLNYLSRTKEHAQTRKRRCYTVFQDNIDSFCFPIYFSRAEIQM